MAKIGFIGMGNMGSAILNGLLRVYKPEDLLFTAAHKEKMEAVTAKTGVVHAASNAECAKQSEYVILAVKQSLLNGSVKYHNRIRSPQRSPYPEGK